MRLQIQQAILCAFAVTALPAAARDSGNEGRIKSNKASPKKGVATAPDHNFECALDSGVRQTIAGFENHAGRTRLDPGTEPFGRVVAGYGNDGESGFEGARVARAIGTYLHGPLLPRNPSLSDWLLAQALAHRTGGDPPLLAPLPDELEARAHAVSAARARARGGKR